MKQITITVKHTYETTVTVEADSINAAKQLIENKDDDTMEMIAVEELEQCNVINSTYNYKVKK